ncbi:MAG: TIM barrel protein [Verrucomicrobia bacterium]|nr:TIM barrel protein [Verrucomicrobiota bacterium]
MSNSESCKITRRQMLQRGLGLAAAGALGSKTRDASAANASRAVTKGRIKQSIVHWCYETAGGKWDIEQMCQIAKQLGVTSVELVDAKHYPVLKKHGLTNAIAQIIMNPDPPFMFGFNNPDHWPRVMKATEIAIDDSAAHGYPSVICFTGYSAKNPHNPKSPRISLEQGAKNCVAGLKKIVGYAEKKNITLCLEMLNTRATDHPMKGHPGYQGDHADYCFDIIRKVASPRLKLLFDIYHVQIMDGDIIRRIRQNKELIGHVHVAGVPGRGELDTKQEVNFPAIMEVLLEVGYTGYVGQEFIPTRDALQGLREAITLCDV